MWLAKIASAFQTHKITGDGLLDLPTIDLTAGLISRNVLTLKVVHGMGLASENAWGWVIVQLQQGRQSSHARSAAATIRRRGLSPAARHICSRQTRKTAYLASTKIGMIHPTSATYESTGILPRAGCCGARKMNEFGSRRRLQYIHRIRPTASSV